jgi:(1->4)-alpha-D-glucan 1-alpha-D-glucosylmutase
MRNDLASVFTDGSYEALEVTGRDADHIIAFARRRGREAAIVVTARTPAPFTDSGRIWPHADAFDAMVHVPGYTADTIQNGILAASNIFTHLPAAVIAARIEATADQQRKRQPAAVPASD